MKARRSKGLQKEKLLGSRVTFRRHKLPWALKPRRLGFGASQGAGWAALKTPCSEGTRRKVDQRRLRPRGKMLDAETESTRGTLAVCLGPRPKLSRQLGAVLDMERGGHYRRKSSSRWGIIFTVRGRWWRVGTIVDIETKQKPPTFRFSSAPCPSLSSASRDSVGRGVGGSRYIQDGLKGRSENSGPRIQIEKSGVPFC